MGALMTKQVLWFLENFIMAAAGIGVLWLLHGR